MAEPSADELKALAEMRLADADAALGCGRASAAYYLAGYAVECGLKAIIALSFRASVIPDRRFVESVYTHDLNRLVAVAGLAAEVKEAPEFLTSFVSTGLLQRHGARQAGMRSSTLSVLRRWCKRLGIRLRECFHG